MNRPFKYVNNQVVELTDEEIAEAEALAPFYEEQRLKAVSELVRAERNARLEQTDYLLLGDRQVSQEWLDYRQQLRNVPAQPGFPDNVEWPVPPT
jgi:hypothetical protein